MAALLLLAGGRSAVAQVDAAADSTESVLVELRLGQLGVRTVPAFRRGADALIPLLQFFDMAGIRATLAADGRLDGVAQPGDIRVWVDVRSDTAVWGDRRVATGGAIRVDGAELYLGTAVLSALLDTRIIVDWTDLQVLVPDASSLPAAQHLRRQAARAALHADTAMPIAQPVAGTRRAWDGFVLDYSWLLPGDDPIDGSAYAVAAGADLLGGALELAAQSEGRADEGRVRAEASWLGVWGAGRVVRQLRLGDGLVTGPRVRGVRGVSVTNAPFVRPSLVGAASFDGRLPDGWEVEAYRGGQLVAFDSVGPDGAFALDLPVLYGENPVDIVAYGPYGEQRTFNRTYRVAGALLPRGAFEYGLAAGGCRDAGCRATANVDLRYGLSSRWTAQAGLDQVWRDTAPSLFHPYAAVTGSVTNAWLVGAEAIGAGALRSTLAYEPSIHVRTVAEYTRFSTRESPLVNPLGRRSQVGVTAFLRPVPKRDFLYIEASAERAQLRDGTRARARLGASVPVGGVRLFPYVRVERDGSARAASYWGTSAIVLPRGSWGRVLRDLWARGAFESRGALAPTVASLTLARPLSSAVRLEGGIQWTEGVRGPSFIFTLSSFLRSVRAFTTAAVGSGGPASLSQAVQGSVLYDRERGNLALAAGPALRRGGVAGRVFLDTNGNGLADPGEPGLPNVRVLVDVQGGTSDSAGVFRVWDVVPFEPVRVTVDSLSLESPLWVPVPPAAYVVPGPNRYVAFDIPVVIGGVIEGTVMRRVDGRAEGVGGVPLTLVERRTGERRAIATFTDGTFYAMGLRAGDWELAVDRRALTALGVSAEPVRFTIAPAGDGAPAGVTIELQR